MTFKKQNAIAAVMILLLGIGVAWAVHRPAVTGQPERAFTALTFNVGDIGRPVFPVTQTAACILSGVRPDVLFLQEMPNGRDGEKLQAALNYPYAGRPDVATGKLGGLMVLSVFPVVSSRWIALPSEKNGAGAFCASLDVDGAAVLACSVHLDEVGPKKHNPDGKVALTVREVVDLLKTEFFSDTVRTASAHVLTEVLAKEMGAMPVILAGDFNTVPGSRTIRYLEHRFQDVLWPGQAYFSGTYHKIAFPVAPRIDYIFASDHFSVQSAEVVNRSAGDHYPVRACLRLRAGS